MIRDLTRKSETDWNEKIQIELSLTDLQLIYDAIGVMPIDAVKIKHETTKFNEVLKKYTPTDLLGDLYEELHVILTEHNGINDDCPMVNDIHTVIDR